MKKVTVFILLLIASIVIVYLMKKPNHHGNNSDYPVLLVGTNAEYKPFCFIENGEIVGFDIDVIKEIVKRLHKQIVIKDLSFDTLLPELQLGNLHVVAAGITPTEKRGKIVLFSKPHFEGDSFVVYVKQGSPIKRFEDLQGKTVAVNEGYSADTYISRFSDIRVLRLSAASVAEGLLALKSGRADAFIVAKNAIHAVLKGEESKQYDSFAIPDTFEATALAISKHHAHLLPLIDREIDAMKKDGTLKELIKKWDIS